MLCCPCCQGLVLVVTAARGRRTVAYCTACPMISEVGAHGVLIDLGNITVYDLEEPLDHPPLLMQRTHALRGRADS